MILWDPTVEFHATGKFEKSFIFCASEFSGKWVYSEIEVWTFIEETEDI